MRSVPRKRSVAAKALADRLRKDPVFDLSKPITNLPQAEFDALVKDTKAAHIGKRWQHSLRHG